MHTNRNGPKAMHYEIYAAPKCHEFVTSVTSPQSVTHTENAEINGDCLPKQIGFFNFPI